MSHLKLLLAFLAGAAVCFTVLYFKNRNEPTYYGDWDDYDPMYSAYEFPNYDIEEIKKAHERGASCQKTAEHPEGCAFFTLISKDEYVEMGLVLAESLRAADSLYPLHALITDSLSARSIELLTRAGVKPVKVTTTPLPPNVQPWREYWRDTYLKLNLWSFEEYERIIYLDADSIVMQNIDPLFQFHGEYHAATDRHLCKHEIEPGMSSMVAVLWPNRKIHKDIITFFNESGNVFSKGDQSVSEEFFFHRKSLSLLNETWASFVFRCQCDDFEGQPGTPTGPHSVHFTGWFRPHISAGGVSIPIGLSASAKECGKPYYDHWEKLWEAAFQRQGLTQEEFFKESIRAVRN